MNGMNFKPFISKLLGSLSDENLATLASLIDTHSNSFTNRSLIDPSNLLSASDKGVGLFTIQLDKDTIRTGYLIYNNSYCVLLSYVPTSERIVEFEIDVATKTYSMVKEFLTTDYLRHEVAIKSVAAGEGIAVQADDIESGSATAGKVLMADGDGGAEWGTVSGGVKLYQHELTFSDNLGSIYVISTQQTPIEKTVSSSDLRDFMLNSIVTKYGIEPIGYLLSAQDDGGDFPITFKFINTNSSDQVYVSTANITSSYMNDLIDIVTEL